MNKVLIIYQSYNGQTKKISDFIQQFLNVKGVSSDIFNVENLPDIDLSNYSTVIIGAPVHIQRYSAKLRSWVKKNSQTLNLVPGLFFSVCLGILQKDDPVVQAAEKNIAERFLKETAWKPTTIAIFGGALTFTQYNYIEKLLMKFIAKKAGGDTDTKKDFEYTDWHEVKKVIEEFTRPKISSL
ncbi:MAG: menaquinone-dependent protoporphyrinogen IX dehydrogenase [Bdellovibrionota bacterium]